jgi:protoheme IX farnesyltransferase
VKALQQSLRDLIALSKPGIVIMCLVEASGGLWLAPGTAPLAVWLWTFLGLSLVVASSNAWNMLWERESDKFMERTRNRPLPSGRMKPATAGLFALVTGVASVWLFATQVNALSAWLALASMFSYVLVYTPLKRVTSWSLPIGAIPGAMPPLIGWAAASGSIGAPGVVLFAILFLWQIPHFLAISLYRRDDYQAAGIVIVPVVMGEETTKVQALVSSLLLVPISLLLVPMQVAGFFYFVVASVAGGAFFVLSMRGFEPHPTNAWARRFFLATLIYLPALTLALILDAWVPR